MDLQFHRFLVALAEDVEVDEDDERIYGSHEAPAWQKTVGETARDAFDAVANELGDTLRVFKAVATVQSRFHNRLRRAIDGSVS